MKNEIVYNLLTLYMNYYIFLSNRMQLRVSNIKYNHLYSIDGFSPLFQDRYKISRYFIYIFAISFVLIKRFFLLSSVAGTCYNEIINKSKG